MFANTCDKKIKLRRAGVAKLTDFLELNLYNYTLSAAMCPFSKIAKSAVFFITPPYSTVKLSKYPPPPHCVHLFILYNDPEFFY